jgi:hypothetical protein
MPYKYTNISTVQLKFSHKKTQRLHMRLFKNTSRYTYIYAIVLTHDIVDYRLKAGLYLNRSGHPLLDNGSVTRFPLSLSG